MPASLRGVPRRVARFVCTLGATANMNGTALFEGVTVLFLAQFFGVELNLLQQAMILLRTLHRDFAYSDVREHYKFQNPLLPDTCWSQYLFYVWKGFA